MVKVIFAVLGFLASELAGAFSFSDFPSSKSGIEAAKPIISKIKAFRGDNGAYPKGLSDLKLTDIELRDLQRYEYKYSAMEDRNGFYVSFNPSGPVYNCIYVEPVEFNVHKSQGWLCTGK